MTATEWLLVSLLGGVGAASRFTVDAVVSSRSGSPTPWGTFMVNLSGSLLIGIVAGVHAAGMIDAQTYALVALGFCGGYTTFSTAMMETVRLAQAGELRRATFNVLGTVVLTCVLAAVGFAAGLCAGRST